MISDASETELRVLARRAFDRTLVTAMVSNILVVWIRTHIHAHLRNSVPIQRERTFTDTLVGIVVTESIVTEGSLGTVGASRDTLLVLLGSVSALRTGVHTSIVDTLSKDILNKRTLCDTTPCGVVRKVRIGAISHAEVRDIVCKPSHRTVPDTVPSSDVTVRIVRTFDDAYPSSVVCIATCSLVVTYTQAHLGHVVSVSVRVEWTLTHATLGLVVAVGQFGRRTALDASIGEVVSVVGRVVQASVETFAGVVLSEEALRTHRDALLGVGVGVEVRISRAPIDTNIGRWVTVCLWLTRTFGDTFAGKIVCKTAIGTG